MHVIKRKNAGENDINFWMPIDLKKSKDENGEEKLVIKGVASTKDKDTDDEILEPSGFDLTYLNKSGFLNWNHGAKFNPNLICGEPTKAKITKAGLEVEGLLYPTEIGKGIYELADTLSKHSKNRRLGFSIEGKALERDPLDSKRITKAAITGIAITHMPKNGATFLDVVKGESDGLEAEYEVIDLLKGDKVKSAKKLTDKQEKKVAKVMKEFADGKLNSSSGEKVKDRKQALAIAYSEAGLEKGEIEEIMKTLSTGSESGNALRRESLDDGTRENLDTSESTKEAEEDSKGLTKAEVLLKIFSDFPDIDVEKAENIYRLVQLTSKQMEGKDTPNQEPSTDAIEKAYAAMGLNPDGTPMQNNDDLEKGGHGHGTATDGGATTYMEVVKGTGVYCKSDEKGNLMKSEGFFVKGADGNFSKATDESLMEKGYKMDKGDLVIHHKDDDEGEKEKGAKINKGAAVVDTSVDNIEKSAVADNDLVKGLQSISNSFEKALSAQAQSNAEMFKNIGAVLGDIRKSQTEFQEQIQGELDIIKAQPIGGRKSMPTANAIEKGFAGGDIQKSQIEAQGGQVLSLSLQKGEIASVLSSLAFSQPEAAIQDENNTLIKGLQVYEASGTLLPEVKALMKSRNIHITE